MLSAKRLGENECGVAFVEEEHLAIGNCTEVRRDRAERDALAATGWAVDAGVAGIADMQVQPERRAARGRAVAKSGRVLRIVRARIHREPWPYARQGQDVGEVLSVYQRTAHVIPAVAGERPEPRFDRVDRFNARVEADVLADLEHKLRVFIGRRRGPR